MTNHVYLINAFSSSAFHGNPAAVVLLEENRDRDWLKSLAMELNQPITAFVIPKHQHIYDLRWFTPSKEIDLCGHGTMGAAHVLWSEGYQEAGSAIQFHTKSGVLKADKQEGKIKLTFRVKESVPVSVTEDLKQVTDAPIISAAWAEDRYILELENENAVRQANPDLQAVQNLEGTGVILTSRGTTGSRYDFISRYFAPKIGIDEDQVTGSAHCALASYWNQKLNQTEFLAYQASKRGGELTVELLEEKVIIGGDCLTLMRGKLAD